MSLRLGFKRQKAIVFDALPGLRLFLTGFEVDWESKAKLGNHIPDLGTATGEEFNYGSADSLFASYRQLGEAGCHDQRRKRKKRQLRRGCTRLTGLRHSRFRRHLSFLAMASNLLRR